VRKPEAPLQWPFPPAKAKVEYAMTVAGFKETGTSLRTIVFGKEDYKFARPVAVAVGRDGRIAVADAVCECVLLYIPAEQRVHKLFAMGKEAMVSPVSVVFDDDMMLYVSDSALRKIAVFDRKGTFLFFMGKTVELARPTGLAFDSDKKTIYALDTLFHKVYAMNKKGELLHSFGGRGTGSGQFNFPTHLTWSPIGRIYVMDVMNFKVKVFDSTGNFIYSFGRQGDGSGDFSIPKGIAVDMDGVIYVVDTLFDNIQLFDERGQFLLTVGSRGLDNGEFWLPSGIFIDDKDTLYVCDTFNQRIQIFKITRDYVGTN
jgi:DNA-binding beta-propeller fold protein YncE